MAPACALAPPLPRYFLAVTVLLLRSQAFDWKFFSGNEEQVHATDELTDSNFHQYIDRNPNTVVMFYAPWCFFSQQMMPQWELVGQKLQMHDPPVHVAKINTHRFQNIGNDYHVTAFPSIKLFVDGVVFDDHDLRSRNWQQIVKWVNNHLDRDHVLSSEQDVDDFLHHNDLAIIGLFPDNQSELVAKSSFHYDDVMFAEVRSPVVHTLAKRVSSFASSVCESVYVGPSSEKTKSVELPRKGMTCDQVPKNPQRPEWTDKFRLDLLEKSFNVTREDASAGWQQHLSFQCCNSPSDSEEKHVPVPSVVMFMPHDERFAVYDGSLTDVASLDRWIQARRHPTIINIVDDPQIKLVSEILGQGQPVLLYVGEHGPDESTPAMKELHKAALQIRGRIMVVTATSSNRQTRRLLELSGISDDELPVMTIVESPQRAQASLKKFRMPVPGITSVAIEQFVDDYFNKKLKPHLKSEPAPSGEDNRVSNVWILVGTTFTNFVQDPEHDVMVNLFAPWCGHCRKFEPQYKELASRLKHVKSLRIAKLDATRNEIEDVSIQGFPTVLLYPARKGRIQQYHGNRNPGDLIKWLKQHCTLAFDETPPPELEEEEAPQSGLLDDTEEDL